MKRTGMLLILAVVVGALLSLNTRLLPADLLPLSPQMGEEDILRVPIEIDPVRTEILSREFLQKLPPIAGRPHVEVAAIIERHRAELMQFPEVENVGAVLEGIAVRTSKPEALPQSVEGIPIVALPPMMPPIILPGNIELPYKVAEEILGRHETMLRRSPGVQEIALRVDGITIFTEHPELLPKDIEGLPVKGVPPLSTTPLPVEESIPAPSPSKGTPEDARRIREFLATLIPAPPGVVVLRPGGVHEQADSCPGGFQEVTELGGWHFCIDPGHPEPIPPIMAPPIAGIPYEEAEKIVERHREEIMKFPGVDTIGLGKDGVAVFTNRPEVLPKEVERLPIIPLPRLGPAERASHTATTSIRPLHGGVAFGEKQITHFPQGDGRRGGTITGVALSQGKPWLITPAHSISNCQLLSPCRPGSTPTLNECPHSVLVPPSSGKAETNQIVQPPFPLTSSPIVGFVQRWTPIVTGAGADNIDVAAAFMDNLDSDGMARESNGSLQANRKLEVWSDTSPPGPYTGNLALPSIGLRVAVVSSNSDPPSLVGQGL